MKQAFTAGLVLAAALAGAVAAKPPLPAYESDQEPAPRGKIDELVFARLKELGIQPARVCSDGCFVRRVFLDVIGTLPTQDEARGFLADRDSQKRAKLIDRLLERRELADYWAMKWADLLRVKSEFPINLWPNAVQAYHRWIRTCVRENMPYDQFVREMLTASGSNFRVPQVNFYRAVQSREPLALAQTAALSFMGVRPEALPAERWAGMAGFFARISFKATGEWKEEIIGFDLEAAGAGGKPPEAVFPDGTPAQLVSTAGTRKVFADWLITPQNPWFTRAIVNRVWSWFLGRGIVHEPDDLRPDNRPSNPQLLAHLERELIAARYDLKSLFRLILNSQTYQLASIARSTDPQAAANFASYPLRRLEAEALIDALCQITGTTEQYSSPIPEPFTYIPENQRTIALADASITSSFLEKFGRPPRDTGMETERVSRPTAAQRLHLLNSSHIQRKIEESPKMAIFSKGKGNPRDMLDNLYLTVLSRYPTDAEARAVRDYVQAAEKEKRRAGLDLIWALINSVEFNYRH